MERETEEEADRRREAAIASAATLRPNFKPKSDLTDAHLSKFQELHRRRLQIKAKSKVHKRYKGIGNGKGKSRKKTFEARDNLNQEPGQTAVVSANVPTSENILGGASSNKEDTVAPCWPTKIRQKLHWGLDTKERWERKSNM